MQKNHIKYVIMQTLVNLRFPRDHGLWDYVFSLQKLRFVHMPII